MNVNKMIQASEQAGAAMEQFAYLIFQYFQHLNNQGFNRTEALFLCKAYQTTILRLTLGSGNQTKPEADENDD